MAHGTAILTAGSSANTSPKSYTVSANQTSGYYVVLGSVKSAAPVLSVADSKGGTWVQRHIRTTVPRTEVWVRTAGALLVIGDTIDITHSLTTDQVVIAAEFNPASINEDSEADNVGTSSSPSASVTTVNNTCTVVAAMGVASALIDSLAVTQDAAYTTVATYQHTSVSLALHMAFKDYTSNGSKTYAPSLTDGISPLSKAWNINLEGLGAALAVGSGGCLLTTCLAGS